MDSELKTPELKPFQSVRETRLELERGLNGEARALTALEGP